MRSPCPFASVTTRPPKDKEKDKKPDGKLVAANDPPGTNSTKAGTNATAAKASRSEYQPRRPEHQRSGG